MCALVHTAQVGLPATTSGPRSHVHVQTRGTGTQWRFHPAQEIRRTTRKSGHAHVGPVGFPSCSGSHIHHVHVHICAEIMDHARGGGRWEDPGDQTVAPERQRGDGPAPVPGRHEVLEAGALPLTTVSTQLRGVADILINEQSARHVIDVISDFTVKMEKGKKGLGLTHSFFVLMDGHHAPGCFPGTHNSRPRKALLS